METAKKVVGLSMLVAAVLASGTVLFSAPAQAEVTKSKYSSSNESGYLYEESYQGCSTTYTSLDFSKYLSKDGSNEYTSSGGYLSLYSYNPCDGSYNYCYGWIDISDINVSKKQATANGVGNVSCYSNSSLGEWLYYPENITTDVTITCSGEYSYNDKSSSRSTYVGPWGSDTYSYKGKGSSCSATVSGSITGDVDTNITLGQAQYSYAQLSDWKSRDTYVTKYRP